MSELFLKVLNMSITGGYVILFVMLFRFLIKKAPKNISYMLWIPVVFRLIIPYSFKGFFSLFPGSGNVIPKDIIYNENPRINSGIEAVDLFVSRLLPSPVIGASVNPLQVYLYISTFIWISGMIVFMLYSIISAFRFKRKLGIIKEIKKDVYETDNLIMPFVYGIIKPSIYLPSRFDERQRNYILLHEANHIFRKDHIVRIFAFIILTIHWFNPLVWIAFIFMIKDMEQSCDEAVLSSTKGNIRKAYANTLSSLAGERHFINAGPLAFGESNIKERIINILNYKEPSLWIIVIAILITAMVSFGLISDPKEISETYVSCELMNPSNYGEAV